MCDEIELFEIFNVADGTRRHHGPNGVRAPAIAHSCSKGYPKLPLTLSLEALNRYNCVQTKNSQEDVGNIPFPN